MRSDAALSKLTEEQQADLFDWLAIDNIGLFLDAAASTFSTIIPRFPRYF
ncbi:MAG TPA: hypothetical protein VM680_03245 [Verrucomicrobiae bacterium]|nr:hypothetical protein [Verrucomicrobiae bacterium]